MKDQHRNTFAPLLFIVAAEEDTSQFFKHAC